MKTRPIGIVNSHTREHLRNKYFISVYPQPDEIYDIYVGVNTNLQLDIDIYDSLLYNARL